jgi:hypothetical protein
MPPSGVFHEVLADGTEGAFVGDKRIHHLGESFREPAAFGQYDTAGVIQPHFPIHYPPE